MDPQTVRVLRSLPWSLYWLPQVRGKVDWWADSLQSIGWVWPFMFTAGALFFTPFWTNPDPLYWRSFSPADPLMQWFHIHGSWANFSNHHFLNLAAVALLCFALAGYGSRQENTPFWKWGFFATYGTVMVWAVHESIWWVVYVITWRSSLVVLSGFGELVCVGLLIFTPILGLYVPKRFIFLMLLFYGAWVLAGFPITESFKGDTPLYWDFGANLWEVASWAFAVSAFWAFERKIFWAWWWKVKHISQGTQLY